VRLIAGLFLFSLFVVVDLATGAFTSGN